MTYIIAEPCIDTKDNSCVEVCPVDCIHPTPEEPDYDQVTQLYIDPEECIDCGACEPVCPTTAIFEESSLPEKWKAFIEVNGGSDRTAQHPPVSNTHLYHGSTQRTWDGAS